MPGGSGLEDGRRPRNERDRENMDRKGEVAEAAGGGSAAAVSLLD